jgi:enoyl-CoA hydratase
MEYKDILFKKQNNICILTINRPQSLNALNSNVLEELNDAANVIVDDNDILITIITGQGKSFVAGADIVEMKDKSPIEAAKFAELGAGVFRKIEIMEKPIIAAVNGFALGGGCELAMACDIRVASEKAKFGQPETGFGIIPGFSGTQRLSRIVGIGKAKELIFTANIINAVEAEKVGLVNSVVKPEELMEKTIELAQQILSNGQLAVRYSKTAINRGYETDIETGMHIEKNLFSLCFATADQKEGMTAFIEKRKVNFLTK